MGDPMVLRLSTDADGELMAVTSLWKIDSFTLPLGTHFVKVIATVTHRERLGYETLKLYAYGYMEIDRSPLVAKIMGGSVVMWPVGQVFEIDGSRSYDPDVGQVASGATQQTQLNYQWSCRQDGFSRVSQDCFGAITAGSSSNVAVVDTRKLRLKASYVLTLNVSGNGRNSSDEQKALIVSDDVPFVRMRYVDVSFSSSVQICRRF